MKNHINNIILFLIASHGIFLFWQYGFVENNSISGNYYTALAYLVFINLYIVPIIVFILTYKFIKKCNSSQIINIKYIIAVTLFLISTFFSIKSIQHNIQSTIFYNSYINNRPDESTFHFTFSCIKKIIVDINYIDFFSFDQYEIKPIINFIIIIICLFTILFYSVFKKKKFSNTQIKYF